MKFVTYNPLFGEAEHAGLALAKKHVKALGVKGAAKLTADDNAVVDTHDDDDDDDDDSSDDE